MNALRHKLRSSGLVVGLFVAGLFVAGRAHAEEDALEALLSESIESTSGKSAGASDSAPALSISITAEDLRRYGIRTLAEAYNFLVMGIDAEDPLSDPEVGARGVLVTGDRGKHVLLLLDGHTLNDQQTGASLHGQGLGLPIEMIDHVEVVLGPGSVLYGANAMFGVVNVITKRAKDFSGVRVTAEASLSPPLNAAHRIMGPGDISPYLEHLGNTYRIAAGAGYEFGLAGEPAELTVGAEYYSLGGPTMTWALEVAPQTDFGPRGTFGFYGGRTTGSYYEQTPSIYARLLAGELEASIQAVTSRVSPPYVRVNDRPLDSTEFDDVDAYVGRRRLAVELKWHHNLSNVTSLMARLYGDISDESSRLHNRAFFNCFEPHIPGTYAPCRLSSSGFAQWTGTELQATLDWQRDRSIVTMLGADARVRRVGFQNQFQDLITGQLERYSDVERVEQAAAVYAQQVYRPATWLTLNAGARWDVDSDFGSRISPRGAIIAEPWRGGTVKGIYSEAMRAPTMDERAYRDPQRVLVSRDLEAESVRSLELILTERFGADSLVFGLFRSWWSNMVVRYRLNRSASAGPVEDNTAVNEAQRTGELSRNLEYVYQYRNAGSIDNWGLNGGWEGSAFTGRLSYAFNVTSAYTRVRTPQGLSLIRVTPRWFGNARIAYDLQEQLPILALAAHFGDKRVADVGDDGRFDRVPYAPASLDLKSSIVGPFPWLEGLSYRMTVDYSFAPTAPYTAGRIYDVRSGAAPQLIPENRFTVLFGLELSF